MGGRRARSPANGAGRSAPVELRCMPGCRVSVDANAAGGCGPGERAAHHQLAMVAGTDRRHGGGGDVVDGRASTELSATASRARCQGGCGTADRPTRISSTAGGGKCGACGRRGSRPSGYGASAQASHASAANGSQRQEKTAAPPVADRSETPVQPAPILPPAPARTAEFAAPQELVAIRRLPEPWTLPLPPARERRRRKLFPLPRPRPRLLNRRAPRA